MADRKQELLHWIEQDRDVLVALLSSFVQARSPNPPGDTREAAQVVGEFLAARDLPYEIIAPRVDKPNIVASFDCGRKGRHLVLNGHMDVFPAREEEWLYPPWEGRVVDDRVYGRGVADMKAGTVASIATYSYLRRVSDEVAGRLTLTAVSDEETTGEWGSAYLVDEHPELRGDCVLNAEPSGLDRIWFAEKGCVWCVISIATEGGHAAEQDTGTSAIKLACLIASELEEVTSFAPRGLDEIRHTVEEARDEGEYIIDPFESTDKTTLNLGVIRGGLKINMVPSFCELEIDMRLPVGVGVDEVVLAVERIVGKYPEAQIQWSELDPPNISDPQGQMMTIIKNNVRLLGKRPPAPVCSPGASDGRFWRYAGVPVYIYGVEPNAVASRDEYVEVGEFLHVVKTHVLSAYDYLGHLER